MFGMVGPKLGEALSHQIRVKLHAQESMVFRVRQIPTQIPLSLLPSHEILGKLLKPPKRHVSHL